MSYSAEQRALTAFSLIFLSREAAANGNVNGV
jgi:hypothetical protein